MNRSYGLCLAALELFRRVVRGAGKASSPSFGGTFCLNNGLLRVSGYPIIGGYFGPHCEVLRDVVVYSLGCLAFQVLP